MKAYLELLRPHHWIKNLFVFIPLIFSRGFLDHELILISFRAFFVFVLISSAVYIMNDLFDLEQDRLHPDKKERPLASGRISGSRASFLMVFLLVLAGLESISLPLSFLLVAFGYVLLNLAYSLLIKQVLFMDVIFVSLGFVFRVLAGGMAIQAVVTDWTVVLVFLFALFISLNRRRQEIKRLEKKSQQTRVVLSRYTIELIDQLNAIVIPVLITSYIFYTFSQRQNNPFFIVTIPIVFYCFFRCLYLMKTSSFGEQTRDYFSDWQLIFLVIFWMFLAVAGIGI